MKEITFFNRLSKFNLENEKLLIEGLLCVLNKETNYTDVFINIILLSDEALLEINRSFLNHDYYTDIITFPIENDEEYLEAELYISIDRVTDNALLNKIDFNTEFKRVLIHGVLHLSGYNDKTEEEIKLMRFKENEYLSSECFT